MSTGCRIDRRQLLLGGLGAGFTLGARAEELELLWAAEKTLVAERHKVGTVDGRSLPGWRLRDREGPGFGALHASLEVAEVKTLFLTLENRLGLALRLEVPGVGVGPRVEPGQRVRWRLARPAGGSYLLVAAADDGSAPSPDLGLAMGLVAPLVVREEADDIGPFDREYTLLLTDLDDRFGRVGQPDAASLDSYEPNYFFLNGLSYPDTVADPSTRVRTRRGERVRIRLINGSLLARSMHIHGYHVEVELRDRIPERLAVAKDTIPILPAECVDCALSVDQGGLYPLHDHYLPAVTANGIYVNPFGGALTVIEAS